MKQIASCGIGLVLLLGLGGITASAQDQTPSNPQGQSAGSSLGAYARQIRKEPEAKSKPKVFDNDNLPREDKLSVVGKPAEPTGVNTAPSTPEESASPAPAAASESRPAGDTSSKPLDESTKQAANKQWADRLDAQQQQIDLLQRELDVTQREYQVRAAAMYGDVGNRLRNSSDWDKQDSQFKQQIADKQKALDEAKQKMEDLREEARKSGVPSSVREPQ